MPFGAQSTAMEVASVSDLRGRLALITGAASGLGLETARALAAAGADLILGVRDVPSGEAAAARIRAERGRKVQVEALQLADLGSVARFAAGLTAQRARLDLVIANAGVSKTPEAHTPTGLDLRFATNHLGHFALITRLRPLLPAGARVVVLSSAAHKKRPLRFDDLQWQARPRDDLAAYGESKTANILFARELTRRWAADDVTANAALPGSVLTRLQRHHGEALMRAIGFIQPDGASNPVLKTPEQGAATTVWASTAPELQGRGGLVLEDCAEAKVAGPHLHAWSGYDPQVISEEAAARLWDVSLALMSQDGRAASRVEGKSHA